MATEFDHLDRNSLAILAREYLLCGHLIDRAAMPFVFAALGMEGMRDVAIDEWMSASPIYTPRMRRALSFDGNDVETIFKGMQLDIGAPPQFMDFRYRVIDAHHGEFELAHCGALMDVEPMGQPFVVTMCHHIEDPTFDATAAATNPRARMRPVHRPPRTPADRMPHCLWTVTIDEANEQLAVPEIALRVMTSRAATVSMPAPDIEDSDGYSDYSRSLEADLRFEAFSRNTLIAMLQEFALQGHLLTLGFMDSLSRRVDADVAATIAAQRFTGAAGIAASRLKRALGLDGSPTAIETVLRLHPAFHPRSYIGIEIAEGPTISLHDSPAVGDRPGASWADVLVQGDHRPLDAIVQALDPRARCIPAEATSGALRTWRVELASEAAEQAPEVAVAAISTGANFAFSDRS